jgi:hypothetical protein
VFKENQGGGKYKSLVFESIRLMAAAREVFFPSHGFKKHVILSF